MTQNVVAEIGVLTGRVNVLMVGRRQVTLSVFRQLDHMEPEQIMPLGRVNALLSTDGHGTIHVVGVDEGGNLCSSVIRQPWTAAAAHWEYYERWKAEWGELPLLVLAGLR